MTVPQLIPTDINAELLLDYYPKGSCKARLYGPHKRNAYSDIAQVEKDGDDGLLIDIARPSLYDVLPEYMFHPLGRFRDLPKDRERQRLREECDAQEAEKENARIFFAPIDLLLLKLRLDIRQKLTPYAESNLVLQEIIGSNIGEEERKNRFISQVITFLPWYRTIRGNLTLITLMLRKVLMEEGLHISRVQEPQTLTDADPRYEDSVGGTLGKCYAGNQYCQPIATYRIHYWDDERCDEHFLQFIDEVEQLRLFLQDWFLAVGEELRFDISTNAPALRLSDEQVLNYLNYNTNI